MPHKYRQKIYKVAILMIFMTILTVSLTSTATAKETTNSLPPIDTAAPEKFETASFGLG